MSEEIRTTSFLNERQNADGPRFAKALKGADSRRLTYMALIAKKV